MCFHGMGQNPKPNIHGPLVPGILGSLMYLSGDGAEKQDHALGKSLPSWNAAIIVLLTQCQVRDLLSSVNGGE